MKSKLFKILLLQLKNIFSEWVKEFHEKFQ
jgi:hypothetical protein